MNKNFLLCLLLFASTFLAAQAPGSTASIFFETDQSELSPEARQTLDALAPTLLQAPDYQVDIEAFTDDRGTAQYNLRLAADRATVVQHYLSAKGLIADKTSVQNWGERKAAGPTDIGRQQSRRVDVTVNSFYFKDFEALQHRLSANTEQVLKIQSGEEQTLKAVKGTLVIVPANAFVFEDGTAPTGEVALQVQEAFDPSDFVLHNLTTMSEGHILETGGMVRITAQSGGKTLRLADGISLTVSIPNGGNFDPSMELFYAKVDAKGGVDWAPTGQNFSSSRTGRVSIPIDPSLGKRIAALKVPDYPNPTMPFFKNRMAPEPKIPAAPYKPRAPQKPTWQQAQKSFAGGGDASHLSRKEMKKAKQYFEGQMLQYQKDSANYVSLVTRYERNLAGYENAKRNYATDHLNWENELKSRLKAIALYKRELRLHIYAKALTNALLVKGKTINQYKTYSYLFESVEYAANRQAEMMLGEGVTTETRKAMQQSSNLYTNIIGLQIIDHYPGYDEAIGQVEASLPKDNYDDITDQMLENTGIRAISDELLAKIREKQAQFSSKSLGQQNATIDGYFTEVTQLGWVNCDRFYNNPAQRMEVVVKETEEVTLYAVCKEIRAMLPFYRNDDGTYSTTGLPKGQKITIVAIKLKDGMPQYSRRDMKVGDLAAPNLVYRSLPVRDLKEELKKLNI